jgi:hypothetical protein
MRGRHAARALSAGLLAACGLTAAACGGPALDDTAGTPPPTATRAAAPATLHPLGRRYLDAVAARDANAVAGVFAPDAVVVDVGREIRGREAIRHWAATEVVGGDCTLLHHTPHAGGTTLLVRFRPGGTGAGFRARYRFDITGELITRATLEYA